MTAPHPYRTALESRDAEALAAILHPDVTFHSPVLEEPLQGRERALGVFAALAVVVDDFEIVDELEGDGTLALAFRVRYGEHRIDAMDHLTLDQDGRVRAIVVTMRPLEAVRALSVPMLPRLKALA
jgi:ketosteroid isomerase-like protein